MALTKVSGGILDPGIDVAGIVTATGFDGPFTGGSSKHITAGVVTATSLDLNGNGDISGNLVIGGNLTANGDFTTLNTTLREVELLRVETNSSEPAGIITQTGTGDILNLYDGATKVVTVDDVGNVGIGSADPQFKLDVLGNTRINRLSAGGALVLQTSVDDATDMHLNFKKARGGAGTLSVVQDGDDLGTINAQGYSGAAGAFKTATSIRFEVDGEPDSSGDTSDMPGRISFWTTVDGSASPSETLRITKEGNVGINSTAPTQKLDVNGVSNFTGQVRVSDGTTSVPSVAAASDTNSGLYFAAADAVGLVAGGSRKLLANSAGISISNGDLTVNDNLDVAENIRHIGNTNTKIAFTANTINFVGGGTTGLSVQSASVRIPTALGINGAAPSTPLDVIANSSGYAMAIRGRSSDNTAELRFTSNDYGSALYATIIGGPTYLKFATGGTNRWQMDSSGHLLPNTAGAVNIGSASVGIGSVFLADDKKVFLGSDQDLEIFHDGSHSRIKDVGTGILSLSASQLNIQNAAVSENMAEFFENGAVNLYYDHSAHATAKLATTATGITVGGEVAASQDYPITRPTLDFNFAAQKKLDPRITYQRTGPASFTDEFGKVVLVGDNVPRFDHNPDTRESKGLLIEESRTNYVIYSKMLEGWSFGVGTDVFTASSGSQLSANPDGSSPAYHYVPSSTAGHHRHNENVTVPTLNTNYVVSLFVKRVTVGSVSNLNRYIELEVTGNFNSNSAGTGQSGSNGGSHVVYDLQDLTIHNGQADNTSGFVGDSKLEAYPNDWYRLSYVFNPGSGSQSTGTIWWGHPSANSGDAGNEQGNNNPSFYFWGAMVEKGSNLTSYIPTNGSTVTRGQDLVEITEEEFSEFYNQTEGSIVSELMLPPSWPMSGYASITLTLSDNSYNNRITLASSTGSAAFNADVAISGSTTRATLGSYTSGSHSIKAAMAYKASDSAGSLNGAAAVTASPGTLPLLTRADIGKDHQNGNALNGHIKRIMYYSQRLPNSQLVTLTS